MSEENHSKFVKEKLSIPISVSAFILPMALCARKERKKDEG